MGVITSECYACKEISEQALNDNFCLLQNYFGDAWNVFDFIIVLGSFIDIIYAEVNVSLQENCPHPPPPFIFDLLT